MNYLWKETDESANIFCLGSDEDNHIDFGPVFRKRIERN